MAALAGASALSRARIITTQVPGERALDAASLAALWQRTIWGGHVAAEPVIDEALDRALAVAADTGGPVVVAGSLYLVGEARRRWLDDPRLRDPEAPRP